MTKRNSNKPSRTARILTSTQLATVAGGAWDGDYGFVGVGVVDGTLGDRLSGVKSLTSGIGGFIG